MSVASQVSAELIPYWYQIANSNHTADSNIVIAIKKITRRCRHVGLGGLLSANLLSNSRLTEWLSASWLRERDDNKREKTERSDIKFVLINNGFDHSKVYNTLTIQFE